MRDTYQLYSWVNFKQDLQSCFEPSQFLNAKISFYNLSSVKTNAVEETIWVAESKTLSPIIDDGKYKSNKGHSQGELDNYKDPPNGNDNISSWTSRRPIKRSLLVDHDTKVKALIPRSAVLEKLPSNVCVQKSEFVKISSDKKDEESGKNGGNLSWILRVGQKNSIRIATFWKLRKLINDKTGLLELIDRPSIYHSR